MFAEGSLLDASSWRAARGGHVRKPGARPHAGQAAAPCGTGGAAHAEPAGADAPAAECYRRIVPAPRRYVTDAIVLSRFDLGEADRVLTLITPEHGKLKAIAKGIRRPTSVSVAAWSRSPSSTSPLPAAGRSTSSPR